MRILFFVFYKLSNTAKPYDMIRCTIILKKNARVFGIICLSVCHHFYGSIIRTIFSRRIFWLLVPSYVLFFTSPSGLRVFYSFSLLCILLSLHCFMNSCTVQGKRILFSLWIHPPLLLLYCSYDSWIGRYEWIKNLMKIHWWILWSRVEMKQ